MEMKTPETWDWVKSRSECSIKQMFMLLMQRVDSDVKDMESLARSRSASSVFSLNRVSDRKVIVARKDDIGGMFVGRGIAFEQTDASVTVNKVGPQGDGPPFLTITPDLCMDGRCRFHAGKTPMELWQVSHAALADLFFERWRD